MSITNGESGFVVSWPAAAANWLLEEAATLPPSASWTRVGPERYESAGAARRVRVSAGEAGRFFRLREVGLMVPGLTGYWSLEEGAGGESADGSGAGARLNLSGAAWASGRAGQGALGFNGGAAGAGGSRAWVSNENHQVLPGAGEGFSVSMWLNPDAVTPGWRGLAGTDANGSNGWRLALYSPGPGTNLLVFAATGGSLSVTGRTLLLPGQWRHLAVTHDGVEGSIFLDHELIGRGTGGVPSHEGPFYLGGGVGGLDSFLGRLDEVKVYARCLSAEELSLAGHWRFEEGAGVFTADGSVQGRHAMVSAPGAWAAGRSGAGVDLSIGQVVIPNNDYGVMPPSGASFSVSFWLRPGVVVEGRSALMSCGVVGSNGWELAVEAEGAGMSWLHCSSTNWGGTLDLRTPIALSSNVWTKLELTFNGGIGVAYVDGHKRRTDMGAIRGSTAPLLVGSVPGTTNFNGVLDELKVFHRDRGESEIGPAAPVMWETVLRNTATNIAIPGSGPVGRTLTYAIDPMILPTNGTVTIEAGATSFTYTAGARKGPDAFTYTISDGEFTTPPTTVAMSVVEPHWLSPTGGPVESRDGSSVAQAWAAGPAAALDAIWKTNNFYDCFFYAPGDYETTGWKYGERSTANTGCKHVGAGTEGLTKTTIRLVNVWEAWTEGMIFSILYEYSLADGFEVHDMVLDCNADNLPKYTQGEPVWIRIPLVSTGWVESVTLRWAGRYVPWVYPPLLIGRAMEFTVCPRRSGTNTFGTNCATLTSTGAVDVVNVGAEADEILIRLERRAAGVMFYGLSEIEITGTPASLPRAMTLSGGESRLTIDRSMLAAFDDDPSTAWASGAEEQAEIILPLPAGTALTQLGLRWNCKTLPAGNRFGAAAGYTIRARDEQTGQYFDVPFVRQARDAGGRETATFGASQPLTNIVTDRLVILLTSREAGVSNYSIVEITLHNGASLVAVPVPGTSSRLPWGNYSVMRAFDGDTATEWASGTQGMVGAVQAPGDNVKFTGLKIIGFGTKAGREGFPMYLQPGPVPGRPVIGNLLVEDCEFMNPATNNSDGVTVLVMVGNAYVTLTNATARRCTVAGIRPYFTYSHGITTSQTENCIVSECGRGVYLEPELWDAPGHILIRSNLFLNVDSGVYAATHPGAKLDSIICSENEFVLSGRVPYQGAFGVCDNCYGGPSGSVTNVAVLNNVVRYADWMPRPAGYDWGILYSDMHHTVFANNVIALGTSGSLKVRPCPSGTTPVPVAVEDCNNYDPIPPGPGIPLPCLDTLLPGYRRTWLQNRTLGGSLIELRIIRGGVDGPALQQQWPD